MKLLSKIHTLTSFPKVYQRFCRAGQGPVGKSHRLQQLLAFACFQWKENKSFIAAFAKKHPLAASKQDVKISWLREKIKCNRLEKNQHQRIFVTSELQFCSKFCQGREGGKPCPQAFDCGKTSRHKFIRCRKRRGAEPRGSGGSAWLCARPAFPAGPSGRFPRPRTWTCRCRRPA